MLTGYDFRFATALLLDGQAHFVSGRATGRGNGNHRRRMCPGFLHRSGTATRSNHCTVTETAVDPEIFDNDVSVPTTVSV